MCGIDELFFSQSLDEKTDSTERLNQALVELCPSEVLRKLIKTRFLSIWEKEFRSIDNVEEALKSARKFETVPEQIAAFIQSISNSGGWFGYCNFYDESSLQRAKERYPGRFAFVQDVASTLFHNSPYGLYKCFKDALRISFQEFVLKFAPAYYGENFHLTPLLFKDPELEGPERKRELWKLFIHLNEGDGLFADHLNNVFSCEVHASELAPETLQFINSFKFLCEWLCFYAKSQELSVLRMLLDSINNYLNDLNENIYKLYRHLSAPDDEKQKHRAWSIKWLKNKRHEINKAWCSSLKLDGLSDADIAWWAAHSYECYLPLCEELSEEKAAILIAWGVDEDLKGAINSEKKCGNIFEISTNSRLCWYIPSFRDRLKKQLESSIKILSFEDRLNILGRNLGLSISVYEDDLPEFVSLPQEFLKKNDYSSWYEFNVESSDFNWWNSLLRTLPEDESFPKVLYPVWTLEALKRFECINRDLGYLALPADKSLGIIRGEIGLGIVRFEPKEINRLLSILEKYSPEKALRHRLQLLRNSLQPFASENLDLKQNSLCPLMLSFIDLIQWSKRFQQNIDTDDLYLQFLISLRVWFASYCLSRLQLRKGEKATDNGYNVEQLIEQSSIWRKAYLKALEELGVDLQGKVHKTAYFIRQFDPEKDVQEVAKLSYKAVRREHNKSETEGDIRRGLNAAYWWLLLAQRRALGLEINEEEAVKTRRRLLRHT